MCKVIEDMRRQERAEGRAEGRVEGRVEERTEVARRMLEDGCLPQLLVS